jgi:DNA invertase Pin-like site-specific DNA recombinase
LRRSDGSAQSCHHSSSSHVTYIAPVRPHHARAHARAYWSRNSLTGSCDAGISGTKGRTGRPGLDQMLTDASRRKFDIVMAWAIDRLGRSLIGLLATIQELETCGVDLYLDQQAIDTTTPMGKLVFQVTGAFAEFERSMIKQRVRAGLSRAVAQGKRLGRPKLDGATERKAQKLLGTGKGILATAKALGIGAGTVQRIKQEMSAS